MNKVLRIGTRESELAVWQATLVQQNLAQHGIASELVYIKSEGDIDLVTPLYALGVQGIFTKTLDAALLSARIDIVVHSMKDVPTQMAQGIIQAAVLKRASQTDVLVYKNNPLFLEDEQSVATIATSSVRRMAQWLNRYPNHKIENLRGNVNTRMQKVKDSNWGGAIFAAAGIERIGLRPSNAIDLHWMLPAPAQGAIVVVCREEDTIVLEQCALLNDTDTAVCTKVERDFLRALMGGCSTPIGALAQIEGEELVFKGNILSPDGKQKAAIEKRINLSACDKNIGTTLAQQILASGGAAIVEIIQHAAK
ncbi:hydroxymethylbilane synthase [Ilyomonas limi]|uniref:Hydroxymethylbilane synthase n=1 Tax=Ilyomonas limi TaxID=2575867 RepID=A0A4V5UTH4_9BACT|nr:hydroxymethylbilane synthase [Ilyomonas limi]TKK64933.1 hydroxymethylbilane synthase [Ilyomonas limi]